MIADGDRIYWSANDGAINGREGATQRDRLATIKDGRLLGMTTKTLFVVAPDERAIASAQRKWAKNWEVQEDQPRNRSPQKILYVAIEKAVVGDVEREVQALGGMVAETHQYIYATSSLCAEDTDATGAFHPEGNIVRIDKRERKVEAMTNWPSYCDTAPLFVSPYLYTLTPYGIVRTDADADQSELFFPLGIPTAASSDKDHVYLTVGDHILIKSKHDGSIALGDKSQLPSARPEVTVEPRDGAALVTTLDGVEHELQTPGREAGSSIVADREYIYWGNEYGSILRTRMADGAVSMLWRSDDDDDPAPAAKSTSPPADAN